MRHPTNNWRKRRTEHRLYADITTRNSERNEHNRTTQKNKKMSNTDPRSYTIHDLHFLLSEWSF